MHRQPMSKKQRILMLLSDGQPHSPVEFIPITHRFSAVFSTLREEGHVIETIPIAHNQYVYQMHHQGGGTAT